MPGHLKMDWLHCVYWDWLSKSHKNISTHADFITGGETGYLVHH